MFAPQVHGGASHAHPKTRTPSHAAALIQSAGKLSRRGSQKGWGARSAPRFEEPAPPPSTAKKKRKPRPPGAVPSLPTSPTPPAPVTTPTPYKGGSARKLSARKARVDARLSEAESFATAWRVAQGWQPNGTMVDLPPQAAELLRRWREAAVAANAAASEQRRLEASHAEEVDRLRLRVAELGGVTDIADAANTRLAARLQLLSSAAPLPPPPPPGAAAGADAAYDEPPPAPPPRVDPPPGQRRGVRFGAYTLPEDDAAAAEAAAAAERRPSVEPERRPSRTAPTPPPPPPPPPPPLLPPQPQGGLLAEEDLASELLGEEDFLPSGELLPADGPLLGAHDDASSGDELLDEDDMSPGGALLSEHPLLGSDDLPDAYDALPGAPSALDSDKDDELGTHDVRPDDADDDDDAGPHPQDVYHSLSPEAGHQPFEYYPNEGTEHAGLTPGAAGPTSPGRGRPPPSSANDAPLSLLALAEGDFEPPAEP